MTDRNRRIFSISAILLAYAPIVILMSWPAPLYLTRRLIGNNVDNWIFYWNNWWTEQALIRGYDWFSTSHLFYPRGTSLVAHSVSYLNSLLALAFKPLCGAVGAYNLTFLLGLWLSAAGAFLWVYSLTRRRLAAFVAGFVFAFTPYHLTRALAHPNLGSIQWWPFYALFLDRVLRTHRIRDALCAGLCAGLTLWSGLQLAVLLGVWTCVYGVWRIATGLQRHTRLDRRLPGLCGMVALSMLLTSAPIVAPLASRWREVMAAPTRAEEQESKQTDLLAYLIPPPYHPIVGRRVAPLYRRFLANQAAMPYPGYAVLCLAAIALLKKTPPARFWGVSGGLWLLLAAGSVLRINSQLYPAIPMPYRLIGNVFPISILRAPDRFNLLLALSLPPLVGWGVTWLEEQAGPAPGRNRWLPPILLLLAFEYLCIPLPMWELPPASPFLEQQAHRSPTDTDAAADAAAGAVVDYPMGYTLSKLWLYYQTIHGHPIVEGHVSRYTTAQYAFIFSHPLLSALYQVAEPPSFPPGDRPTSALGQASALGPALRSLRSVNVRYIFVHKPYLNASLEAHLHHLLPLSPVYADETLTVYDLSRPAPFYHDEFPVTLNSLALARFNVEPDTAGWQFQLLVFPLAPPTTPITCQIQLRAEPPSPAPVLESPLTFFEPQPDGATWMVGDLQVKESAIPLRPGLPLGTYHWSLVCPRSAPYTAPDNLYVYADGSMSYLRHRVDVEYQVGVGTPTYLIRLRGYRWRVIGTDLYLTLEWEALEAPQVNYKVFVHLLDAAGRIMAQYDAMPCRWQCPTAQWQAGETITDEATLPLENIPAGDYRLAVGLYDAATQARLAACDPQGAVGVGTPTYPCAGPGARIHADGYYILPEAFSIGAGNIDP